MFDDLVFRDCLFKTARVRLNARCCAKLMSEYVQDIAINSNNAALCDTGDSNAYEAQEYTDRVKATNIDEREKKRSRS